MYYLSNPELRATSESFPPHLVTACPLPLYYREIRLQVGGQAGGEKLHTGATSLYSHDERRRELDQSELCQSK